MKAGRAGIRWKWGIIAAISMMLLALYPHLHFRLSRGEQWNGSYAAIEGVGDEVAYSAYVNALLQGRPRRNDPYTGSDHGPESPQSESLFSIQFVPAYLIAFAARVLGISASTAFIWLAPLTAACASFALFWLLAMTTQDSRLAAAGTIVVLCLGTVAGGHGLTAVWFGSEPLYNSLVFLRRYQPSASFPFLIVYFALVWRAMTTTHKIEKAATAIAGGLVFALLVFSYVYLWTAAVAWLACIGLLWLVVRPDGWKSSLKSFSIIVAVSAIALVPFAILYSNRSEAMDVVQALEVSHAPDLFRLPEIIAAMVLLVLTQLIRNRFVRTREHLTLFAAAFALVPFAVFNQQVVTGRSLQPLHYEMFAANYAALISVILVLGALLRSSAALTIKIPRKALLWMAIAAFEWGSYETFVATRRSLEFDRRLDEARAVALRLQQLASSEKGKPGQARATVLSSDLLMADGLPTTAPQAVLWAPHMLVFSGRSNEENKERFYEYLYYTGISADRLREILTREGQYGFAVGLFGFERTIKGLSINPKPITKDELENELQRYSAYCASFTLRQAEKTPLTYLVVPAGEVPDLYNLDRWYRRDSGEQIGQFLLYRVSRRTADTANNARKTDINSRGSAQRFAESF